MGEFGFHPEINESSVGLLHGAKTLEFLGTLAFGAGVAIVAFEGIKRLLGSKKEHGK